MTVSELTAQIKILIEGTFLDVWVEGEISNFRRHSSGHWYFTLKDDGALLRCASFRMQNRLIRFLPEDGLKVRASGRLSLYEARGEYQLLVEYLEPVGAGALQLAFEQLKTRLAAEGLFEIERKRPLPMLPRRIGVVTSQTGAAIRDILRILRDRNESVQVVIAPARVQGEGAALEIARAIEMLNALEDVDVIIVGRGGGSIEDLWCFNEEPVARAIHASRAPVISAVGHETDFTIADFVADFRAPTPSAAAEMVTLAIDEIYGRLEDLRDIMSSAIRYRLLEFKSSLAELSSSRAFNETTARILSLSQRVDTALFSLETSLAKSVKEARANHERISARLRDADIRRYTVLQQGRLGVLTQRLRSAAAASVDKGGERLAVAAGKLGSLSPLAVLSRGYAIAFDSEGRIIKRAADVRAGEQIRVRVAEGEINCTSE